MLTIFLQFHEHVHFLLRKLFFSAQFNWFLLQLTFVSLWPTFLFPTQFFLWVFSSMCPACVSVPFPVLLTFVPSNAFKLVCGLHQPDEFTPPAFSSILQCEPSFTDTPCIFTVVLFLVVAFDFTHGTFKQSLWWNLVLDHVQPGYVQCVTASLPAAKMIKDHECCR